VTKLILPYPPSANIYWRHNRGRTHRSQEANEYIAQVGWLCVAERIAPIRGNVCLSVDFYRPAKRGDLDNLLKVLIDALRGYAYDDDKQIIELHAGRYDDKNEPRAVVVVSEMP
jgi:crossover junction endodeoxyribonuclease RusA